MDARPSVLVVNNYASFFTDDGRSVQTSKDSPLTRTKQERLSPSDPNKDSVKVKKSLIENEYNLNRRVAEDGHDVSDDAGGFSTEWSYEEQFKKVLTASYTWLHDID